VVGVHALKIVAAAHHNCLVEARHKTLAQMIREHTNARIGKTPRHFQVQSLDPSSISNSLIQDQRMVVAGVLSQLKMGVMRLLPGSIFQTRCPTALS
jgi:hypothetical protein